MKASQDEKCGQARDGMSVIARKGGKSRVLRSSSDSIGSSS